MPDANDAPEPQDTSAWSRDAAGKAHLIAAFDPQSGNYHFPPPPKTLTKLLELQQRTLSNRAILYSYTVLHPHKTSSRPPFTLAYVDFPEGIRLMGRLDIPAGTKPKIGGELETALEGDADGKTDYFFRPVKTEADK
ncbi:MAG: OB-fold domain-containing protein [Alphaproteobacteria bacterium]|nr:OB-fold domain-containing protein [Alphaproteobacteria bacterium]